MSAPQDASTIEIRAARTDDEDAVLALLQDEALEAEFVAREFVVAHADGRLVACARLKPLRAGGHELASVAVSRDLRGRGVGAQLVAAALAAARGPVYALALAPGFFARLGFVRDDALPPELAEKLAGMCASRGAVPMRLRVLAPDKAGR